MTIHKKGKSQVRGPRKIPLTLFAFFSLPLDRSQIRKTWQDNFESMKEKILLFLPFLKSQPPSYNRGWAHKLRNLSCILILRWSLTDKSTFLKPPFLYDCFYHLPQLFSWWTQGWKTKFMGEGILHQNSCEYIFLSGSFLARLLRRRELKNGWKKRRISGYYIIKVAFSGTITFYHLLTRTRLIRRNSLIKYCVYSIACKHGKIYTIFERIQSVCIYNSLQLFIYDYELSKTIFDKYN